jgi:hypothetical protein
VIPLRIVEDGLRICSTSARVKVELLRESSARELLGQLKARLATCPSYQCEYVQADIDRIAEALAEFRPRPDAVAAARAAVSTLHPDHGGPGGAPYQQALARLRKAKEKAR